MYTLNTLLCQYNMAIQRLKNGGEEVTLSSILLDSNDHRIEKNQS
jgi:hypothetical protein